MSLLQDIINGVFIRWYDGRSELAPQIICDDGFSMSVQAGKGYGCTPQGISSGPFTHVEVATSNVPRSWQPYSDGGGIFHQVPVGMVAMLIEIHGGELSTEYTEAQIARKTDAQWDEAKEKYELLLETIHQAWNWHYEQSTLEGSARMITMCENLHQAMYGWSS